ncbi:polysaccharide deacetylase family protein [Allocoleopsis sp.]|uniref:polysaccharide deacetylase family protein n=1 Tax=Allocoleopsis sp. TaxID=3088169 RepID=UPI002FD0AF60
MKKSVLLSFDIEEFDIPEEYGQIIDKKTQFEVSLQGLKSILPLLEKLEIRVTFFVTANFAIHHEEIIREISQKHEIASHGFYHASFSLEDLEKSRKTLEQITNKSVIGFRMARLREVDDREIRKAGYKYNSSMNPTYIPGRYNNFFKKRTAYYSNKVFNIPVSVTPRIRFPLFWLSFKNFPLFWIQFASQITLENDSYLCIYFHPWEFTDINKFQLPGFIKKRSGREMVERLEKYLISLKTQGDFITFSEFANSYLLEAPR